MAAGDVVSQRDLNRALLARQLLLRRAPMAVPTAIEHLIGLQAQAPFPPYFGLWSRLDRFQPDDLGQLLLDRGAVRIALMRGTVHLVTARDCLRLRPVIQPRLDRVVTTGLFGRQLAGLDLAAIAAAGRALIDEQPRTSAELAPLLAERWPGREPRALTEVVRSLVACVQVPPRAVWGRTGQPRLTSAEAWLGRPLDAEPAPDRVILRYLAAFGPASVLDMQSWSGLTRLAELVARLRPELRVFRGEDGRELFDLPEAPRPGPDVAAPVRLVAEFDNLILAHADRTRILSRAAQAKVYRRPNAFPGVVLIDGFVAGSWRLQQRRGTAVLAIEQFGPWASADTSAAADEGGRLLAFAAPDAEHDVQFSEV